MSSPRNLFVILTVLTGVVCAMVERQVLAEETLERSESSEPPESPVQRLRREGIRAMSSGDPEKLAAAGFNLTLAWERPLRGAQKTTSPESATILNPQDIAEAEVEKLRSWARRCRGNDIIMMYMMYVAAEPSVRYLTGLEPEPNGHLLNYIGYGGRDALKPHVKKVWPAHQYRRVVDWHGEAARWAPCPLERRYWNGFIRPQLELVACILNETGASGGAALELETYCFYSIYPGMASQKKTFCYCDYCFYGFARSLGNSVSPVAVLPRVRFDWLTQRGLRPRYERYLETEMAGLIEEMLQAVRKIDPNFLFGMYPYAPFWYYDALIRGSGTTELPCLLFPSAEYYSGYTQMGDPRSTFFGDTSTAAGVAHLRRRKLSALYAGGIWNFSNEAIETATDRLVRGADGYWIYMGRGSRERTESIWELHPQISQWTKDHPGPLPTGDLHVDAILAARRWVDDNRPDGVALSNNGIASYYGGENGRVYPVASGFEDVQTVTKGWKGRGSLPPLDTIVFHSGRSSIRFEPSAERSSPTSPYIDQQMADAQLGQAYELSFWVKTAVGQAPIQFWIGRADSSQWPGYMRYTNVSLPAGCDWMQLRTHVSYGGTPPLVIRFWCAPTDGKLWLDDIALRPVQVRTVDVPLNPPADANGWGSVAWTLSPWDAICKARIVDAEDGRDLRITLYPGDSLAPLAPVIGVKPVVLRLEVYPSADEPVILEDVQVGFTSGIGKAPG